MHDHHRNPNINTEITYILGGPTTLAPMSPPKNELRKELPTQDHAQGGKEGKEGGEENKKELHHIPGSSEKTATG